MPRIRVLVHCAILEQYKGASHGGDCSVGNKIKDLSETLKQDVSANLSHHRFQHVP